MQSEGSRSLKRSSGSEATSQSRNEGKENIFDINLRKFEEISLKKGISEKLSEKGSFMRNTSASISQLTNYTSTCERTYSSKMREGTIKPEDQTFRQLYF